MNFFLMYYDSYHQDPKYWSSVEFQVNVFLSEPPVFLNGFDNLTVNMWSVYLYDLPDASDPNNDTFTISVIGNNYFWTEITQNGTHGLLKLDASQLGPLTEDTGYVIEIKIKNSKGSFTTYGLNVLVLKYIKPYFSQINSIVLPNLQNKVLNFAIISEFELPDLHLQVQANEWTTNKTLQWISNTVLNYDISVTINPIQASSKAYWVILYGEFTCKNSIR